MMKCDSSSPRLLIHGQLHDCTICKEKVRHKIAQDLNFFPIFGKNSFKFKCPEGLTEGRNKFYYPSAQRSSLPEPKNFQSITVAE